MTLNARVLLRPANAAVQLSRPAWYRPPSGVRTGDTEIIAALKGIAILSGTATSVSKGSYKARFTVPRRTSNGGKIIGKCRPQQHGGMSKK